MRFTSTLSEPSPASIAASPRILAGRARCIPQALLSVGLMLGLCVNAGAASAVSTAPTAFTLQLETSDFGTTHVTPEFSRVRNFIFEIDLFGSLEPGQRFGNSHLQEVRYNVNGSLSTNPRTPSGFAAFALNRFANGEGPISAQDWREQGSLLRFEIAASADLSNGLQLSELVPNAKTGAVLEIDARERGRLDRARYHAPQMLLFADGTGIFQSSINSSLDTGTVNPATRLEVKLNFGDEYITRLDFDPTAITIVEAPSNLPVPEPGTAILLGLGLVGLASCRRSA